MGIDESLPQLSLSETRQPDGPLQRCGDLQVSCEDVLVSGAKREQHALGIQQVQEVGSSGRVVTDRRLERGLGLGNERFEEERDLFFLLLELAQEVCDFGSELGFENFLLCHHLGTTDPRFLQARSEPAPLERNLDRDP